MRTFAAALIFVVLLPIAAFADCTGAQPNICISVNQPIFQAGQGLQLFATVTPGTTPPTGDVYVALLLPTSTLLFLKGDGTLTTDATPLVPNWSPTAFAGQVFAYTFGGGEPAGTYVWLTGFAQPGTLNFIGNIASAPFQFTSQAGNLSGTYLLTGTLTQSGCGPGSEGPFLASGTLTLTQSGANLSGAGSFSIPQIGASTTAQFTGMVGGTSASGSFTETTNGFPGSGLFTALLSGNFLGINVSGSVTGTTCSFNLTLGGTRQ